MNASTKIYANVSADQYGRRLDGEILRRVVESKTTDDALKALGDYGYSYVSGRSVDGFITAETNRLIEFVAENAPSEKFANALIAEYLYNNAKLAYKSRFIEIPHDAYFSVDFDAEKVARGDYTECDPYLEEALYTLDANAERKPQNIDAEITRAMYKTVLACPIPVVKKYYRASIDCINISSAARIKKLNLRGRDEFITGGNIDLETLNDAAYYSDFAQAFYGTPYEDMAENLARSEFKEFSEYSRDTDDYLLSLTDSIVADMSSYKPFLEFYTRTRIDLKTLKTALVCVKTDSRDLFYSRRPDIYV